MFLRKLCVLAVPLLLLAAVCLALPLLSGLGFWGNALKGLVLGGALGLLLPLSGADRHHPPFASLMWIPAVVVLAVLVIQYLLSVGYAMPTVAGLSTGDGQIVLAEAAFAVFMLIQCIRFRR